MPQKCNDCLCSCYHFVLQKTMDFEIEDNRYKTILPRKHDLFKASLKKIEREKKMKEIRLFLNKAWFMIEARQKGKHADIC